MTGAGGGGDWARVRELFERALDVDASERASFLDDACGADHALRLRVERLLRADESTSSERGHEIAFDGAIDAALLGDVTLDVEGAVGQGLVGRTIGGFRTISVLGAGGMGVVLLAEQDQPRREIALKVLAGGLVTESARRRFAYESEALALLRHPHIAQVFASGMDRDPVSGQPLLWIAMERVEDALPLDRFAAERGLDGAARVDLLLTVCDAVAHGHRRSVLHRDLKPGNVLVGRDGRPVVIDFGIARATDAVGVGHTLTGQVLGTPRYMSPEQFAGRPDAIDTRTDVFALGVILFELIAGRPPRDPVSTTLDAFAREVMESEPPRLSALAPGAVAGAHRDLEWIIARAMARRPEDRYASVDALAADLRRFREGHPVEAGPPSTLYVLRRFVRRHRTVVLLAGLAVTALLAGAIAATWGWVDAARSERLARAEASTQATVTRWLVDLLASARADRGGRSVRVLDLLAAGEQRLDELAREPVEVEAALRNAMAQSWLSLGENARARAVLTQGRNRLERELPEAHSDRAEALYLAGVAASADGDLDEARAELGCALALRQRYAGPESEEVAHVRHALAGLAAREGRGEDAIAGFAEVERMFATHRGPGDEKTLEAVRDRIDTAHRLGDYERVRDDLDRALRRASALPADHPLQMSLRLSAANDARDRGDLDAAEAAYGEVLRRARSAYGAGSAKVREVLNNLAVVRQDRGDFDGAIAAFGDLVSAHEEADDGEPLQALIARNNLASTQLRSGRVVDARASYDGLLERAQGLLPDGHWLRAMFLRGRGAALVELGEFEAAEQDLLPALDVLTAQFGDENPRSQRALESVVTLYERWERPERAAGFRGRMVGGDGR